MYEKLQVNTSHSQYFPFLLGNVLQMGTASFPTKGQLL